MVGWSVSMAKQILHRLQPVFVVAAALFIVLILRSQWTELSQHPWQLRPGWLAVSAGFLLAAWATEIQIWRHLLHLLGHRLAYWPSIRVWFLSAITRYIPGNIWQPLSMTVLCQRRGVPVEATLTSILLYQVLIILAVAPIFAVYVLVTGNWGLLTGLLEQWTPLLLGAGLAPLVVFFVQPAWLIDLINWLLGKLHRRPLVAGISRRQLLGVMALAIGDWMLWGASFAALGFALQDDSGAAMLRLAPHLIAAYPVAYAVGFISVITPSGLGVREAAFYVLLAPVVGGGAVTVLAIAMRLWTTLGELLMAGIAAVLPDHTTAAAPPTAAAATAAETSGELSEGLP